MSCKNDSLAFRPRKPCLRLPEPSSSQPRARSSRWTRHLRICSSTSLPPYPSSCETDFGNADPLDTLSEITLDSDLYQFSASSATLLSPSLSTSPLFPDASHASSEPNSPARLSESRPSSCSLPPLYEPGQLTAQRVQRLRTRTAAIIMMIPATREDTLGADKHEPREVVGMPPIAQKSKLRRVAGVRDLRRAFRDADPDLEDVVPDISLGFAKASYELGILPAPAPPSSQLSTRSSQRTLVDFGGNTDLKTLCGSTFSSITLASRYAAKIHSTSASWSSRTCLPTDTLQPITPTKHPVDTPSEPRLHRYVSLHHDTHPSRSPGEAFWSCAKISQSAVKRAARRGHTPRRVFSNPIAALSPQRQISPVP